MSDNFYAFDHKCDAMPEAISFIKHHGSESSLFMFESANLGVGKQLIALWGFKFCPYCGIDPEKEVRDDRHDKSDMPHVSRRNAMGNCS